MSDTDPGLDDLLDQLGERWPADGRVDDSLWALVGDGIAKYPESSRLWCILGDFIQIGTEDDRSPWGTPPDCYRRAAEADPANPEPHESLGHYAYTYQDWPSDAVAHFRRAIALGAGRPSYLGLGQTYGSLGDATRFHELVATYRRTFGSDEELEKLVADFEAKLL